MMDEKEAIKCLKSIEKSDGFLYKTSDIQANYQLKNDISNIIELLQRGEKYYAILKEIEYNLDWHKPDSPFSSPDGELIDEIFGLINDIKQKYFPKGG